MLSESLFLMGYVEDMGFDTEQIQDYFLSLLFIIVVSSLPLTKIVGTISIDLSSHEELKRKSDRLILVSFVFLLYILFKIKRQQLSFRVI